MLEQLEVRLAYQETGSTDGTGCGSDVSVALLLPLFCCCVVFVVAAAVVVVIVLLSFTLKH